MNKNLMNWLESRKTYAQVTAHPAHKNILAAEALGGLFHRVESKQDLKLQMEAQNLTDLRIKEFSQRAGICASGR